jgi:structural maintenance of chromosome 3 (chondroitin sulfate proteoglycan 6)
MREGEVMDQSINDILRDLKRAEAEKDSIRSHLSQINKELQVRRLELQAVGDSMQKRGKSIETLQAEIDAEKKQIALFQSEQGTKLSSQLSAKEKSELDELEGEERLLASRISVIENAVVALTVQKERIRADLKSNLQKRYFDILLRIEEVSDSRHSAVDVSSGSSNSQGKQQRTTKRSTAAVLATEIEEFMDAAALLVELERQTNSTRAIEFEVNALDNALAAARKELVTRESIVEALRTKHRFAEEEVAVASKQHDKILNKRSLVFDSIQEKQRMIRELGSVPRKEMDDFKNFDEQRLLKKLKEVNEKLKAFASVNRKALDQYVNFNEQRAQLMERKQQLDVENKSIETLIQTLDRQKDETILSTFRTVNRHFSAVFSELVPGGHGELVLRTSLDEQVASNDVTVGETLSEEISADLPNSAKKRNSKGESKGSRHVVASVNTYSGIMVRVSFAGSGQQYSMQQLSGGQKALVALSLIFAIQRYVKLTTSFMSY